MRNETGTEKVTEYTALIKKYEKMIEAEEWVKGCTGMHQHGLTSMWYETEEGGNMVNNRLQHIAQTQAKTLITGCSFCLINFKSAHPEAKSWRSYQRAGGIAAFLRRNSQQGSVIRAYRLEYEERLGDCEPIK